MPPGAALAPLLLAACGGVGEGGIGYVEGFLGGVVAPEPRAALVGRDVLAAGGGAADAAVAAYFALAVTLPSSAGLGGGGACLVHDPAARTTEALLFPAGAPAAPSPYAVPANARGMFALHARRGAVFWADLLRPAERLARDGAVVSRALAAELAPVAAVVRADPLLRDTFTRDGDRLVGEGDQVRQPALATTLAALRQHGAGDLHGGRLARQLAADVAALGGAMTARELRAQVPAWRPTLAVAHDGSTLHFTPPPADGGAVAAQLWALADDDAAYGDDAGLFAAAAARALAARPDWPGDAAAALLAPSRLAALRGGSDPGRPAAPPPAPLPAPAAGAGSAAFIAVDRGGGAVACAVTMGGPLGSGRAAPVTGVVLAAAPAAGPEDAAAGMFPGAAMLTNANTGNIRFAAAASGGSAGATALAAVARRVLGAGEPAAAAVAAPRVHAAAAPGGVLVEPGLDPGAAARLRAAGHRLQPAPALGRVSVLSCPGGLPREAHCAFVADGRGHGLAASDE